MKECSLLYKIRTLEKLIERATVILNENAKKNFLEHKKKLEEIEEYLLKDISKNDLISFFNVLEKMKSKLHEYNV